MLLWIVCAEHSTSQTACSWCEPGEVACGLAGSRRSADLYQDPIAAKGCRPLWAQSRVVLSLCPAALNFTRGCTLLIPLELQTSTWGCLLPNACTKKVPWVTVTSGLTAGFPPSRPAHTEPILPSDFPQACRALKSRQAPC